MYRTYFEELERAEAREAERRMFFTALKLRRSHLEHRGFLATLLWLLGVSG